MGKPEERPLKDLPWSEFPSSLPLEGVVYPKGKARMHLFARMRKAFAKVGLRETA